MRRRAFIGIALLALSHLAFAHVSSAHAQAGSAGGIIGKQDKSISGEEPADVDRRSNRVTPPRALSNAAPKQLTAAAIEGNWDWEASCTGEQWQGGMTFHAVSTTGFVGEFNKGHEGSVVGTISGSRLSFVRNWRGIIKQTWTAPVTHAGSALRMQGPFTDPLRSQCRFSATKG